MSKTFLLAILLGTVYGHPGVAGREGNGGDICEDRIQVVRDDIRLWIEKGGAAGLELPVDVSLDTYKSSMLNSIKAAKISCTADNVQIGTEEKTCENQKTSDGTLEITCNRGLFLKTNADDQYILVHHEFAGLAGLEVNDGDDSKYPISNQITGFLETHVTKSLVVKPTGTTPAVDCASLFVIGGRWGTIGAINVAGPTLSAAAGAKNNASFDTETVNGKDRYAIDLQVSKDGSVAVTANLNNGTPNGTYQSQSLGFVTGASYSTTVLGTAFSQYASQPQCKIRWFVVTCAATQEAAKAEIEKRFGKVDVETMPSGCGL